jgi:hypothetical protein
MCILKNIVNRKLFMKIKESVENMGILEMTSLKKE